jgi:hypothetical protein
MIVMVKRGRKSPEQIVRLLGQTDAMLASGEDIACVCRAFERSKSSFHRLRNQYGGLKDDGAKRLKELEKGNATLKRLLAFARLGKSALLDLPRDWW